MFPDTSFAHGGFTTFENSTALQCCELCQRDFLCIIAVLDRLDQCHLYANQFDRLHSPGESLFIAFDCMSLSIKPKCIFLLTRNQIGHVRVVSRKHR